MRLANLQGLFLYSPNVPGNEKRPPPWRFSLGASTSTIDRSPHSLQHSLSRRSLKGRRAIERHRYTMVKSSAAAAATAVFVASILPGSSAQEAKLWYPDYSTSYESGRCTDQPSSSLLKLANYASFGYKDQATCCQESFPGQMKTSSCASDGLTTGNSDIPEADNFDVDVVFEKLMNDTVAFETYRAEQEKYWFTLSSVLTSLYS